jgi:hypothetical protein
MQVGSYRQLRDARTFLLGQGLPEAQLPPELFPGMPRAFWVRDPDGHLIELYDSMHQVLPQSADARPAGVFTDEWPETVDDDGLAFLGEPYLGPLE